MGEGFVSLGEKGEGIKKYKLQLQNRHRDVTYRLENIVNDILITIHGVKWVQELLARSLCK